ncbi:MAG: tetratricopeptide repeat protein [Acidobacteriota bacterium]
MIFCQSCKAANAIGREYCSRCNARLMIIVIPRGLAPDVALGQSIEEHLLERISTLEYALTRTQERFERVLDLMHRQATSSFSDHTLLDAVVTLLGDAQLLDKERLEAAWQARLAEQIEQSHAREMIETRRQKILAGPCGNTAERFAWLVQGGLELVAQGKARRGVRLLEKAILLAPDNIELNFFLGEYFYHEEKLALAEHYLKRVIECDSKHYRAVLMLGIICGDEGEIESAKQYLQEALNMKDSFAAHYGLGRILASEGRLDEALPHFKRALLLKPTPEMYYVVGHAYLERGQAEPALRHLRKAIELDPQFDAAFYHLGLIYLKRNLVDKAREHFRAAYEINPLARYRSALRARAGAQLPSLPVFGSARVTRRRVLTSGDIRLARLLRNALMK